MLILLTHNNAKYKPETNLKRTIILSKICSISASDSLLDLIFWSTYLAEMIKTKIYKFL